MKTTLALMALLASTSAFANTSIDCGTEVNKEDGIVGKREFMVSSEDDRKFKAFDKDGNEIKNAKIQIQKDGSVLVTVGTGRDLGGLVGTLYKIAPSNGNTSTTATQTILGGVAGGTQLGKLDCIVSED